MTGPNQCPACGGTGHLVVPRNPGIRTRWYGPCPDCTPRDRFDGCVALICGGRNLSIDDRLAACLREIFDERRVTEVIHGDAPGADRGVAAVAEAHGIKATPFPAHWDDLGVPGAVVRTHPDGRRYNAAAGTMRNQRMLDEGRPSLVIALPGGRGTADMTARAKRAGIPVIEVR